MTPLHATLTLIGAARQRHLDLEAADAALYADYARRRRDGGPWDEDDTYLELNDAVGDALEAMPWWQRAWESR